MNHLIVEQNSNIEVVTTSIISKLAEMTQDCDEDSNLAGNLQTTKAYKKDVDFLTEKFPGLQINTTQGFYIDFKDKTMENIVVSRWGDGIGVMASDLQFTWNVDFQSGANKSLVTSFEEFRYFTGVTSLYERCFSGYENMESIIIPQSVTQIGDRAFENCYKLKELDLSNVNLPGVADKSTCCFKNCTSLEKIKLGDCVNIGKHWASYDDQNRPYFVNCTSLKTIDIKSLTTISTTGCFTNCPNIKNFILRSSSIPTESNGRTVSLNAFGGSGVTVYVPDESVEDYKAAWSQISSNIKPISEYEED